MEGEKKGETIFTMWDIGVGGCVKGRGKGRVELDLQCGE